MAAFLKGMLTRFRPVAVPGAPVGGAVPADRETERLAELAPVFAALADMEAQTAAIRSAAVARAAAVRAQAADRAEEITRDAQGRRDAVRELAARQALLDAERYRSEVLERSHARVAAIGARSRREADAFAARVVARVLADLDPESAEHGS